MYKILYTLILCLFVFIHINAQDDTLKIKTQQLKEVVVEKNNRIIDKSGFIIFPTTNDKRHSADVLSMLSKMSIPEIRVDGNLVKTHYEAEVKLFVDGIEAQDWEIKAINPKDVIKIEFKQNPSEPQYRGYLAVMNFILKKYKYGGYVVTDDNQSVVKDDGNYSLLSKVNRDKMTYQVMANILYSNDKGFSEEDKTYTMVNIQSGSSSQLNKLTTAQWEKQSRTYNGAFGVRYDSEKIKISLNTGLMYKEYPKDIKREDILYSNEYNNTSSLSIGNGDNWIAYIKSSFSFPKLSGGATLNGNIGLSYNKNISENIYQSNVLTDDLINSSKEKAWLPSLDFTYTHPIRKANKISVGAYLYTDIYNTHYLGTDNSFQRLISSDWTFRARYDQTISSKWIGTVYLDLPVSSYKVNDYSSETEVYLNGGLLVNGRIGDKHSIFAYTSVSQTSRIPLFYNTVVRQDSEIEGTQGNYELKTSRMYSYSLNYSWLASNVYSMNITFWGKGIFNDKVNHYFAQKGLMMNSFINSGDYHNVNLNISPSIRALNNKLNMTATLYGCREKHSGIMNFDFYAFSFFPSLNYIFNNHFSANATASIGGKGYMMGRGGNISKFSDILRLSVQYTTGNLFLSIMLETPTDFKKYGRFKTWEDSKNMNRYQESYNKKRYATINLRYTFNFGRKVQKGDDIYFQGSSKSSVL